MENPVSAAEVDPLKRGEDGAEMPSSPELKKKSCSEVLGFAKLTHWRTAVFFLSLFLCLTIVFAFSFIIPCPVRPQYLIFWNRTFPEAETYDFLATEDTNRDKVKDILFVLRGSAGSQNNTCTGAGLPSPCVFFIAVDGTDGSTLWERPLDPGFHWAQCGLDEDASRKWDCLLAHSKQLSAIDKHTGKVMWQQPQPPGLHTTVPVVSVPDLDGDKFGDVALVMSDNTQTRMVFLSGKTGLQIGSTVVLSTEAANHVFHRSAAGSDYVLLRKETGLYGLALWRIAAKAKPGSEVNHKKDTQWEKNANRTSGLVPIYESDSERRVLRVGQTDQSPNMLLVTGNEVLLVDGKTLRPLWRFNTSSVLREPSFGHFNKDGVLDVVVEDDVGHYQKRVIILDGKSGSVLWEATLLATPNSPIPASIHTINSFSIFVLWGKTLNNDTVSVPRKSDRHIYMLHPLYSDVLLESTRSLDHILTFKATLLERGRHAAYILLTGPETQGVQGTVVLSKRKLKQDVADSRVCLVGTDRGSETNDVIKEAFSRLRFSD